MSFVSTQTMIPLHRLAVNIGVDPYHFSQIYTGQRPMHPDCPDDWYQYSWQADGKLSREGLALALRQAEDQLNEFLGWSPLPMWHEEEVQFMANARVERQSNYNALGRPKSVAARWGYVLETGRRQATLVDTPATVITDEDGDGYTETVTITFATTATDAQELKVFYPGKGGSREFEIRPLSSLSISAGIATITFPKYLIPLEALIIIPSTDDDPHIMIDGDDDTNFLTEVDVYWERPDPSQQITFTYSPADVCSTTVCEGSTETGCLFIKDSRLGILAYTRADWDADTEAYSAACFTSMPAKATVYYRAGKTDIRQTYPELQMDNTLERLLCFFALTFLDTELCGCNNTRNIWDKMNRDMSSRDHNMPWDILGNPFGTSFAAINLWKYVQQIKLDRSPVMRF